MKIRLERAACMGHAMCHGIDDELFPLDDEGYCALDERDVEGLAVENARAGVDSCPEQALSLDDTA